MGINTQKVVTGGIVAGIVMAGLDFLVNGLLLADQNRAAMEAINPDFVANMEGATGLVGVVLIDLLMGLLLVWTYAAMRPRFGAGPKTAAIAGVQLWVAVMLMYAFMVLVGMFSWGYFVTGGIFALIMFVISGEVGAMLYREE